MKNYPIILGINFGGHDTSACLIINGKLIAACEEERYNKEKHTKEFPTSAISDCLDKAKISINSVDEIALTNDPIYLIRENYLKAALNDDKRIQFLINDIDRLEKFFNIKELVKQKTGFQGNIECHRHHLCHLASSYYLSGFKSALLISHDGMGEIECSSMSEGIDGEITSLHKGNRYPNSLGLFYSAITYYLGWKHHSDEGIIMGLAPFGDDNQNVSSCGKTYKKLFKEIIYEVGDYDYEIDLSWIAYHHVRDKWISDKFIQTFGPIRKSKEPIENRHKHIAAALQNRIEEIVINQLKKARKEFNHNKVCISGGVGLNCSLNGKILSSNLFDEIFVQPASGDDGAAIGACLLSHKKLTGNLKPIKWHNYYLGSEFSSEEIEKVLQESHIVYTKPEDVYVKTTKELSSKKIIGWFQNGAEFGPRALGNRSILTAPFPDDMKDYLNARVKFREEFRPFAPAILNEHASNYFHINQESPHMLITANVKEEKIKEIPAVVHIDNSARVQTVTAENNLTFRKLLEEFFKQTNCPVLLNTSFNVKGQPIVNTPKDALSCFLSTKIDILIMGDFFIQKKDNENKKIE